MAPVVVLGALVLLALLLRKEKPAAPSAAKGLLLPGPVPIVVPPSAPRPIKSVPKPVAEAVRDMAAGTANAAQLRNAAADARASGFGETAAVMDQTATAMAEVQGATNVPESVIAAIEAVTSGTATPKQLHRAAADAYKAKLRVTATMLSERATFLETGHYPSEPGAAEQAQVVKAVEDLRGGRATIDQLLAAADVAKRTGKTDTADALLDAAKRLGPPPTPSAVAGETAPSRPWPDVPAEAWARFVRAMAIGDADTVTETGKLGLFLYDPRRLQDLGLMSGTRMENGRRVGDFIDEARWLRPATQVNAFARDMARIRSRVESEHAAELGKEHAGRAATLSGLLAVAHAAGVGQLGSWLRNDEDKTRFPNTTAVYLRGNGIF